MDSGAIMSFAGVYLDKHKHLTAQSLQKFIMEQDEVKKAICITDIEMALSMLYCGYFIKISHNSDEGIVYIKG
jgi:hypothetical protein